MISSAENTKSKLLLEFEKIRALTEKICEPLEPEDYTIQACEDISPPKWHLAHTTWFYEIFILEAFSKSYQRFYESYYFLFNSYYKSAGPHMKRFNRGVVSRPSYKKILEYRKFVTHATLELIETLSGEQKDEAIRRLELGMNHEQQHQELLITDIKFNLFSNPVMPAYLESSLPTFETVEPLEMIGFEKTIAQIGSDLNQFCFDNETPRHEVLVSAFGLANRLITNKEFLGFIEDDGYQNFELWLSDGWDWVNSENVKAPLYWVKSGNEWFEFTLHGLLPLDLNQPVTHISFFEADAFARWAGKRLPTEFEWELAAKKFFSNDTLEHGLNPARCHFNEHDRESKIRQLMGYTWQWTISGYLPYPGFQPLSGTLGEYNGKFMNAQRVLRGSSCATPPRHSRITYRNFFQSDKRWQFTGLRLAETE